MGSYTVSSPVIDVMSRTPHSAKLKALSLYQDKDCFQGHSINMCNASISPLKKILRYTAHLFQ